MIAEQEQKENGHVEDPEVTIDKSELGKRDRDEDESGNNFHEENLQSAKKFKDEVIEASENANGNIEQLQHNISDPTEETHEQVIVANDTENVGNSHATSNIGHVAANSPADIEPTHDNNTTDTSQSLSESKLLLNEYIEKNDIHDVDAESMMNLSQALSSPSKSSSKHITVVPIENDNGEMAMLEVSPEKVGSIIGSKGSVIQEIQLKSGAKVIVDQNFPDGVNRVVKITGNPNQVKLAVEYVIKVVEEGPSSIHVGSSTQGSQVTTIIECPQQLVGRVIGGSGHVIKDIQSRTNTKVVIDQSFPDGVPRKIIVTGNHEAVANATSLINHVMQHGPNLPPANSPQNRYQAGGSGQNQQNRNQPTSNPYQPQPQVIHVHQPVQYSQPIPAYMPQMMPQQAPTVAYGADFQQKTIEVAKQFVGRIIGKGGSHVVSIGKQSGCQIRIDQEREPCRVNISGPAAGIALAETMIQEVMLNIRNPPSLTAAPGAYQHMTAAAAPGSAYGIVVPNFYNTAAPQPVQMTSYSAYAVPSPQAVGASYAYPMSNAASYTTMAPSQYTPAASVPNPYASANPASTAAWKEYKTDDGKSYWHNPSTGVTQVRHQYKHSAFFA
jgi:rRNA processing protein Krr1/Pno1